MSKIKMHISWKLLRKATVEKLEVDEAKHFVKWLSDKKENNEFFEKAKLHYRKEEVELPDYEPAYQDFLQQIIKKQKRTYFTRLSAVASIAVLIVSAYFLYNISDTPPQKLAELSQFSSIQPMKGNIELILSDGRQLILDDKKSILISELSGQIEKRENTLDYSSFNESEIIESKQNTLKTPKGKSLKIILSDSTVVWLNAESSISYMVPFEKDERKVSVEGEAYFEVTKNALRPFIVESNGIAVEVLGTKFDINSYDAQNGIYTTLIEGSVNVRDLENGNSVVLKPNQQAFVSSQNEIIVEEVNVDLIIDWKDGKFIFDRESLGSIFKDLGRWYDFEFQFETDELKELEFSGFLERYQDLNVLLELFEDTKALKFTMNENVIFIGEYRN